MYKMFIFLKTNDDVMISTFGNKTVEIVKELNTEFTLGIVEGSALTDEKFTRVIEIKTDNVHEMNKLMISAEGKNLTRHLSNFMGHFTTFFIEY